MSDLIDIYTLELPFWAKRYIASMPVLARRAGIDSWRAENYLFVWSKDSVDYFCRNMEDIHHTVSILECSTNNKNPGWSLQESIDLEIRSLEEERKTLWYSLNAVRSKIKELEGLKNE